MSVQLKQHCVTFAAGLALNGGKVLCFIPATFLPRAFDQIIDVCLLKVPAVFVLLDTGIRDSGPTHQGVYTFPLLNMLPHTELFCPADTGTFEGLLDEALGKQDPQGPVFIQVPRGDMQLAASGGGICEVRPGTILTVIVLGNLLSKALWLAEKLPGMQVIYVQRVVPVELDELCAYVQRTRKVLVLEDGLVASGVGQHIMTELGRSCPLAYTIMGVRERFPTIGTLPQVYDAIGMSNQDILDAATALIDGK